MKDSNVVKFTPKKKKPKGKISRLLESKGYALAIYFVLISLLVYSIYSATSTTQHTTNTLNAAIPESTILENGDVRVVIPSLPSNPNSFKFLGRINGTNVVFVLDTGATQVAIPTEIAQKLNLMRGPSVDVETAAGASVAYMTNLNTVSVGDIEIENIRAGVATEMEAEYVLLGMNFLRNVDLKIENGKAILLQKNPSPLLLPLD